MKNTSISSSFLKIYMENQKSLFGISSIIFKNPSMYTIKSDFELAYNDNIIKNRSSNIREIMYILYILIILVIFTFILESKYLKDLIFSRQRTVFMKNNEVEISQETLK